MRSQEDAHRAAYLDEARELLADLEASLLELERTPEDVDLLHKIFRALHTVKGSGAMFGFDDIAAFTHDVESIFDRVRNGFLAVDRRLLDLSLGACDHLRSLLEPVAGREAELAAVGADLLSGFRAFGGEPASVSEAHPATDAAVAAISSAPGVPRIYRLRLRPHAAMLATGNNPLHLLGDLMALGECRFYAHTEDIPELSALVPETCLVWWDCVIRTESDRAALADVFVFVEDDCDLSIEVLDDGCAHDGEAVHQRLGEILVARGDITAAELEAALSSQRRLGDILAGEGLVSPPRVASALLEQSAVRELCQKTPDRVEKTTSIRVAADKLDALVDLVGELVIVQAQIRQAVEERGDPLLRGLAEHLERLGDSLRDSTLSIRMLPIGATFAKFRRLVRDLATELGKEIELVTVGEETELDKTVIERLGDPLVHLLRNSIDHGVESPEKRTAAGKPATGVIRLAAEHCGGEVVISVADDGAGLDSAAIRVRAEERGLIQPGLELTTKELYNLIFLPGFSTAGAITNISGRGVGMDVVKRAIEALRGIVEIDSEPGQGTSITVRLPLTLAIIDGLQVEVGGEYYVVPLSLVEECLEMARGGDGPDTTMLNMRGQAVPCLRLREVFDIPGRVPAIEPIVVVTVDGAQVGLAVDRVIGEHQTVIKGLGPLYRDIEEFSGATIRGDGRLALILDVAALVRRAAEAAEAS
ncbi:CheA signal transduction histidine kinase [Solidesulfovibrio carbinoliphilus subsp. oakridgensis]|uniref:Chemotaxis protein CheA n=1 Tax=Solidesulfovibrio carbinoliphilus subsp. oakridgensis TaxID=694327 RepID=G7Q451_9BACT|nr:chemotaxis protein CheA [Solidesulfovibrio carbinoliphilus]EHJ46841.1 CheA signal transduction histidine kinase [Solidesulfovibrio carbinoliphilus subsp. oakridgensis]